MCSDFLHAMFAYMETTFWCMEILKFTKLKSNLTYETGTLTVLCISWEALIRSSFDWSGLLSRTEGSSVLILKPILKSGCVAHIMTISTNHYLSSFIMFWTSTALEFQTTFKDNTGIHNVLNIRFPHIFPNSTEQLFISQGALNHREACRLISYSCAKCHQCPFSLLH